MFYIQDGGFSQSLTTHEAILTAATSPVNKQEYGAGVFAFVTAGGASLVFEDSVISEFLSNGTFTLIVGIDDITNTKTLDKLEELKNRYAPRLTVRVFYHTDSNSLFHPKFIWFKVDGKLRLITGSSNLTEKGLRRNREAFTLGEYSDEAARGFEAYWEQWIHENNRNLRDLDDEEVIAKAKQNSERFIFSSGTRVGEVESETDIDATVPEEYDSTDTSDESGETSTEEGIELGVSTEEIESEDYGAWVIEPDFEVLVAEIPNNNNRWKQANFNKESFVHFFGGIAGVNQARRILLRNVEVSGRFAAVEIRLTVSVASQNYRIELNAATGDYPTGDNRPIGVFIKVSTRSFVYIVVMPDDANYNEVLAYLNASRPRERANWMRRHTTSVSELMLRCPSLEFWRI